MTQRDMGLLAIISLLGLCSVLHAAEIFVNDASVQGDVFCSSLGSDEAGDGSAAKPFASLEKALAAAQAEDTIQIDTGDYQPVAEKGTKEDACLLVSIDRLKILGAGITKSTLHSRAPGTLLRISSQGVEIRNLTLTGGRIGIELCGNAALLEMLCAHSQATYGILIRAGSGNVIRRCQIAGSGFRGLQITEGGENTVEECSAVSNANGGFCLSKTRYNVLRDNLAQANGASGFFITEKSKGNKLTGNTSFSNGLGGFYLYGESHENLLERNLSRWNQRGFVLKNVSANILTGNGADANTQAQFQIRGASTGNQLTDNAGEVETAAPAQ